MADRKAQHTVFLTSVRLLGTIARIRADERRNTLGAFLTLLGFMAGHALLETARDALFLASLPASQLPWVYLIIAAVALVLTQNQGRITGRLARRHELSGWLVLSSALTFVLWLLIGFAGPWIYYVLYTWSGVLATLLVVRFWTVLTTLFTLTQAKRLFAVVGSGSVVGAIVGSAMARILTSVLPAHYTVLAAAVVFLVTTLGPRLLEHGVTEGTLPTPAIPVRADLATVFQTIWDRPYLRLVGGIILMSTITFTLVDFVFKSTVDRFVAAEQLGAFFSTVYLTLNVTSLFVQVGLVAWLLRRFGVTVAQAAVPALLFGGAMTFAVGGGLVLALVLKAIDGATRYSLYRTGAELLFIPMSVDIRSRVKALIDVLGQRGGQAAASLIILLGLTVTTNEIVFATVASVTALLWLYMVLGLKPHYLNVFRETLSREITDTRIEFPSLDMASLESLLTALNSPEDRTVVAALDLLDAQGKSKVIPALILYHPSPAVAVHALELFLKWDRLDALPIVDRLLLHSDPTVRATAVRVMSVQQPDEQRLRRAVDDAAPEVVVSGWVGLIARGWAAPTDGPGLRALHHVAAHGSESARLALAQAIRQHPVPVFHEILPRLLSVDSPNVAVQAIRAMGAIKSPDFVGDLIARLGRRTVRDEVGAALVQIGPPALQAMGTALADPTQPHAVRRHLPQAMAAFGSTTAVNLLQERLLHESDGMIRFKILRALGTLQTKLPGIALDHRVLDRAITQTLGNAYTLMRWRRALEPDERTTDQRTPLGHILVTLLRDKQRHAVERLFRLLNLRTADEDFLPIYRGLQSPRRESQASSRELLEHLLDPPIRESLLELIDDMYESEGSRADPDAPRGPAAYREVLRELVECPLESVSSVAAAHAAELEVQDLTESIAVRTPLSADHREVLDNAVTALDRLSGRSR